MNWKAPITDRVFEDTVFARNNQGNSEHNKGALNYTDLNRIEDNYKYILERLGEEFYHIPHKSRNYTETVETIIQPEIDENIYIQSTGTQYIDTGFVPNQDTRVVCKCEYSPTSVASWLFGVRTASGQNAFSFLAYNNKYRTDYKTSYSLYLESTSVNLVDKNKNITIANGTEAISDTYANFDCKYSLSLFAINTAGTFSGYSTAKIYSCQIYDNDVLVRDFIPAKDSNNIVCLYDKVSQTYFYNQGTGEFVLGTDNGPLEYIESTGTQYIDTGVNPTNNTRIILDVDVLPTNISGAIQIASATNGTNYFVLRLSSDFKTYQARRGSDPLFTITHSGELYGRHLFDINKEVVSVDGIITNDIERTFSIDYPIFLCCQNNKGATAGLSKLKIYSCKIYSNDVLVRNFISYCKDGIVCLYDKVSDSYFYNAGTGSFIGGGAIITTPEPEMSVETITYTDWHEINIPWKSEIDRIRRNHNNLASLFLIKHGYTEIEKKQYLNYEEVNKLEDIDLKGKEAYEKMTAEYILCGTISCGGDLL